MGYCTEADIKLQIAEADLIQLTDDADTGEVDSANVARAIEDADAEIDGYLGMRHALPLSSTPAIIRRLSVEIAIHNLYARRQGPPDFRAKRYDAAIRMLEKIAEGSICLGAEDDSSPAPIPGLLSSNPERIFTRDELDGF